MSSDRLYQQRLDTVPDFRFDEAVAAVFPDMLQRSIPSYASVIETSGALAGRFIPAHGHGYDLGASLGASTLAMLAHLPSTARLTAVDNSPAMVRRLHTQVQDFAPRVAVIEADIDALPLQTTHFTVLNYTLQFIPLARRDALLARIGAATAPGGALWLSEKIRLPDPRQDALQQSLHHDFKRANGYSDLEVSQKRAAIEQVLVPESEASHRERLLQAGFRSIELWFRHFNFCSILAIK